MSEQVWALVLGCTAGAGGAIARRLLTETDIGVIGVHRGHFPQAAQELEALAQAHGRRCVLLVGDAGRLEGLPTLVAQVRAAVGGGRIRLMVHCCADASAGYVVHPDPRRQLHPRQILKTFEVMAHSFLFWGQALVQEDLMEPGGQLLAMFNLLDAHVATTYCAVGASKAALVAYVQYMSVELARHKVRVNGLRFGATPTEAFQRMPGFQQAMDAISQLNPMGRTTQLSDVADFVTLLMDPRAGWVNGAILDLDGGERFGFTEQILGFKGG